MLQFAAHDDPISPLASFVVMDSSRLLLREEGGSRSSRPRSREAGDRRDVASRSKNVHFYEFKLFGVRNKCSPRPMASCPACASLTSLIADAGCRLP